MYPYAIGLDIGITSVGWASVALDEKDRPYGILGMGSRIFTAAEQAKTGESLAAPRREARGMRRRLRRHRHRNERIRALLLREQVLTEEALSRLFEGRLSDIYALRVRALDEPVTNEELARILIHISQRRGFKSNRKAATSKEDGELLSAVTENKNRMAQNGYRTVAELFLNDSAYCEHRRNKGGVYIATVSRDMVADEVRQIFAAQRKFGNKTTSEELENEYLEILLSQRSFDEGPGEGSPYRGGFNIGKCTFETEELRAAKASYSFEYFSLLTAVNNIRIVTNRESAPLTNEQRMKIVALAHRSADLHYGKFRKELQLTDDQTFNMVSYRGDMTVEEAEKKKKFPYMQAYHKMRIAFDKIAKGHFDCITKEQRNAIGDVLSKFTTSSKIRPSLAAAGLSENDIDAAETLNFSGRGNISVKACEKLIPHLEQGMKYNDACAAAGYDFKGHGGEEKTALLPPLGEDDKNTITSPVVLRAISQSIKVINAIIRERGCSPTFINIELAREMAKDHQERSQIKKEQDENHANNERIMKRLREEYGLINPTGQDLVKFRLFEEQGGVCAYSLKQMSLEHLFDADYAEIDHIIPYSISFDDSRKNKVLVLAKENRDKGSQIPMQYLTGERRDQFVVWVNSCVKNYAKRKNLLKEEITEEDRNKFIERNLQDTKTASSFMLNYIRDHLQFMPFATDRKEHVTAVNGAVTSYLRKRWGISKVRANGDLHHAVDAVVIACTTRGMIQKVGRYAQYRENRYARDVEDRFIVDPETGEVVGEFPYPWKMFREELEARLSSDPCTVVRDRRIPFYLQDEIPLRPLFVSRMPQRKVTGSAHEKTIKSTKELENNLLILKKELTDLKLDKDGEIPGYYRQEDDRLLYEALKARLQKFGGDGKKAFADPFYKPKSDGTQGPIVKKVKLQEKATISVSVHGGKGAANNDTGSMVRIDVFYVENDGYYFVPIYVADTLKPALPSKACVQRRRYSEWKEMRDSDFLFSLYPNDLLKVTSKKAIKMSKTHAKSDLPDNIEVMSEFLYYCSADISTVSINCENHDGSYKIKGMGIKTLESMEKYTVDVLGGVHPVKRETRQSFRRK